MGNSKRVLLIDNYDSFTWNIYEYLCQEGAEVAVFRNDEIDAAGIEKWAPDTLVISPGPGHPKTDSGVSGDCIKSFAGKIPVIGVCMGQQCMFEVFGGEVAYAGEIVHGKTTPIYHDNMGIFKNVPQGVSVTRYHSLAGTPESLPDALEVTARTESGIIMGVRHKKYTVEGVQFHPESILTEEGHLMIKNILNINGGTWEENDSNQTSAITNKDGSILDRIYAQRKIDVEKILKTPGFTMKDLEANLELSLAPPPKQFYSHLKNAPGRAAVIAEIKRASPSKGDICIEAVAAQQASIYGQSGVSAISVLTEPHWFKGSLQDLVNVRRLLDVQYASNEEARPCVLRKEFIFCKYQIAEARLAGADSVLLIVKMLTQDQLKSLYDYSKELGMEPLVEVNSKEELERASQIDAKVIGVNNRNLHSFTVDLDTTSNLVSLAPKNSLLIALSGILSVEDADKYKAEGVHGFLVGEALMRSSSPQQFISGLSK